MLFKKKNVSYKNIVSFQERHKIAIGLDNLLIIFGSFKGHVKATFNSLNEIQGLTLYFLLHILVAYLKSFPKS